MSLYTIPHKALRFELTRLLVSMGRNDFEAPDEVAALLAELEKALWLCDDHIEHEERVLRPALAGRTLATIATLDTEHREHAEQVAEVRGIATALARATTNEHRIALGGTLYLHFSVFVAGTLAHMAYEERVVQPLLDRLFSPGEQEAMNRAITASIGPREARIWLRTILQAVNRRERDELEQHRERTIHDHL
jgi:iron-sulfur cluster repair protein YtfE (RIC family)